MDEAPPKLPRSAPIGGGLGDDAPAAALAALRLLRKHWPILLVASLVAAALGLVYSKSQPRVYEAATMLEFDPDVVRPLADKTDPFREMASSWDNHEFYETQYKVMTSDRVLSAVVRDLGLQSDPSFAGKDGAAHPLPLDSATDMLRGRLHVEPVKNSRLTYIKVEDTDPKQAQKLANAISNTYIAQNLEKTVNATGDAVVWLNSQLDHFRTELESNENSLHDFKKQNDLPSSTIEEISKQIRAEMSQYDSALTTTRTHKQELLARNAELANVTSANPDDVPASELLSNGFLNGIRTQYQTAMRERDELIAGGKGEKHPLVLQADERIAQTKKQLLEEVQNIRGAVQRDLAIINREEAGESQLYEEARRKAVELNLKELEFHRLDRVRAENEKVYDALLEQTKDADLARMMNVNNVRIVDTAQEPRGPIRPRVPVNVAVGALTGLLLGIGLVLLREQADSSLKSPADVEQRLGVAFLGMVPAVDANDDGSKSVRRRNRRPSRTPGEMPPELLVHERPLSSVAEAARTIRTNLMFMNPDQPYRSVLVTSAAPGEGKTTVACSLAISLAQGGQKVCIVDCDLRRPRLHRIFERVGDAGAHQRARGRGEDRRRRLADGGEQPVLRALGADPAEPGRRAALRALPRGAARAARAVRPGDHRQPAAGGGHRLGHPLDPGRRDGVRRPRLHHLAQHQPAGAARAVRRRRAHRRRGAERGRHAEERLLVLPVLPLQARRLRGRPRGRGAGRRARDRRRTAAAAAALTRQRSRLTAQQAPCSSPAARGRSPRAPHPPPWATPGRRDGAGRGGGSPRGPRRAARWTRPAARR